jgi:hypothetical protein
VIFGGYLAGTSQVYGGKKFLECLHHWAFISLAKMSQCLCYLQRIPSGYQSRHIPTYHPVGTNLFYVLKKLKKNKVWDIEPLVLNFFENFQKATMLSI